MTCNEFIENFNRLNSDNSWWVHFEGRNIEQTLLQIEWLDQKAISENWRHQLTISVELEKPDRLDIQALIKKVVYTSRYILSPFFLIIFIRLISSCFLNYLLNIMALLKQNLFYETILVYVI